MVEHSCLVELVVDGHRRVVRRRLQEGDGVLSLGAPLACHHERRSLPGRHVDLPRRGERIVDDRRVGFENFAYEQRNDLGRDPRLARPDVDLLGREVDRECRRQRIDVPQIPVVARGRVGCGREFRSDIARQVRRGIDDLAARRVVVDEVTEPSTSFERFEVEEAGDVIEVDAADLVEADQHRLGGVVGAVRRLARHEHSAGEDGCLRCGLSGRVEVFECEDVGCVWVVAKAAHLRSQSPCDVVSVVVGPARPCPCEPIERTVPAGVGVILLAQRALQFGDAVVVERLGLNVEKSGEGVAQSAQHPQLATTRLRHAEGFDASVDESAEGVSVERNDGARLEMARKVFHSCKRGGRDHPMFDGLRESEAVAAGPIGRGAKCAAKSFAIELADEAEIVTSILPAETRLAEHEVRTVDEPLVHAN